MKQHLSEVGTWMSSPPMVIHPKASLFEAYNRMFENDLRRLPVVDTDNNLIGIVTMSDVQRSAPLMTSQESDEVSRMIIATQTVEDIMTPDPVTIAADDTVQEASERMLEYEVSGLPVVEGEKLVGIITESDIFRLVVESWTENSHLRHFENHPQLVSQ